MGRTNSDPPPLSRSALRYVFLGGHRKRGRVSDPGRHQREGDGPMQGRRQLLEPVAPEKSADRRPDEKHERRMGRIERIGAKAGSSDDVEIGLYSRDRPSILLRKVRGLARGYCFHASQSSPKAWRTSSIRFGRPRNRIFVDSGAKEDTGQNEAAAIIVFNDSNQK
jgi:hypothetical protein